jgi:small subunit ribosomal protein S20
MAHSQQAKKRVKQAIAARNHNFAFRTEFRNAIKKLLKIIASGDKNAAVSQYKDTQSTLDRIARKGIFHKNKAARHKSKLSAKIKAMA